MKTGHVHKIKSTITYEFSLVFKSEGRKEPIRTIGKATRKHTHVIRAFRGKEGTGGWGVLRQEHECTHTVCRLPMNYPARDCLWGYVHFTFTSSLCKKVILLVPSPSFTLYCRVVGFQRN